MKTPSQIADEVRAELPDTAGLEATAEAFKAKLQADPDAPADLKASTIQAVDATVKVLRALDGLTYAQIRAVLQSVQGGIFGQLREEVLASRKDKTPLVMQSVGRA
jgi:hypothetical protein